MMAKIFYNIGLTALATFTPLIEYLRQKNNIIYSFYRTRGLYHKTFFFVVIISVVYKASVLEP